MKGVFSREAGYKLPMTARTGKSLLLHGVMSAGLALLLAACVNDMLSIPPVEAPRVEWPGSAPAPEPGSALEREHKRLIAGFGGIYTNPAAQTVLDEMGARLRLVSDRPNEAYTITVLNSPSINAFALPNGYVYLTRGVLALANDTAEIASVIAHESAHVLRRHAMERAELESRSVLVSRVMTEVLDNPGASQFMRDQSRIAFASFSRQQELEADEIGVRAIARAGYEVYGATRFLEALDRAGHLRAGIEPPDKADLLSTHPPTPERIAQALQVARQYGAPGLGEADRTRWLAAISGMTFGEDPMQGVIRGQRFYHPRLRFVFDAPEGFMLENTPNAVLGVTSGAKQAMRFDSSRVEAAAFSGLTAQLAATPIEGVPVGDLTETSISGFPAATGLARGQDWAFRIVLIRAGDYLYRLIYAAQGFNAELDAAFMASAQSFRRLDPEEAKAIRPLRIRLAKADIGTRAEDIVAAHMQDIPKALEQFLLINGLGADEALIPGQMYKIIAGS